MKKSVKMRGVSDYTVSPGSLAWVTSCDTRTEHMTEFSRDAGSDFPLLRTGLCPDREENHYMQLAI